MYGNCHSLTSACVPFNCDRMWTARGRFGPLRNSSTPTTPHRAWARRGTSKTDGIGTCCHHTWFNRFCELRMELSHCVFGVTIRECLSQDLSPPRRFPVAQMPSKPLSITAKGVMSALLRISTPSTSLQDPFNFILGTPVPFPPSPPTSLPMIFVQSHRRTAGCLAPRKSPRSRPHLLVGPMHFGFYSVSGSE